MNQILKLTDKDMKAIFIKMLQKEITKFLEINKKIENLSKEIQSSTKIFKNIALLLAQEGKARRSEEQF